MQTSFRRNLVSKGCSLAVVEFVSLHVVPSANFQPLPCRRDAGVCQRSQTGFFTRLVLVECSYWWLCNNNVSETVLSSTHRTIFVFFLYVIFQLFRFGKCQCRVFILFFRTMVLLHWCIHTAYTLRFCFVRSTALMCNCQSSYAANMMYA